MIIADSHFWFNHFSVITEGHAIYSHGTILTSLCDDAAPRSAQCQQLIHCLLVSDSPLTPRLWRSTSLQRVRLRPAETLLFMSPQRLRPHIYVFSCRHLQLMSSAHSHNNHWMSLYSSSLCSSAELLSPRQVSSLSQQIHSKTHVLKTNWVQLKSQAIENESKSFITRLMSCPWIIQTWSDQVQFSDHLKRVGSSFIFRLRSIDTSQVSGPLRSSPGQVSGLQVKLNLPLDCWPMIPSAAPFTLCINHH